MLHKYQEQKMSKQNFFTFPQRCFLKNSPHWNEIAIDFFSLTQ